MNWKLSEILNHLEEAASLWESYCELLTDDEGSDEFWAAVHELSVRIPALRNQVEEFQEKHANT